MASQQQNIAATISSTRAYGAIYWATPAATSNETDTPIKCAGTTAQQGSVNKVTAATTNRLTFTGSSTRAFHVTATVGLTAANATTSKMHIYSGGSLVTGSTITRAISNGTDTGAVAIQAFVDLAPNGYVELWCETNDGDDITIQNGTLAMISID